MNEIAAIVIARGWSQEELARRYADAEGSKPSSGNVSRHFRATTPRPSTVEIYRQIVGMTAEHADLVQGRPLTSSRWNAWSRTMFNDLQKSLKAETNQKVVAYLSTREAPRDVIVRTYALAEHRSRLHIVDHTLVDAPLSAGLRAIAPELHEFDLVNGVRRALRSSDSLLSRVFMAATDAALSTERIDALLLVASALAEQQGLEMEPMRERLDTVRHRKTPSRFVMTTTDRSEKTE